MEFLTDSDFSIWKSTNSLANFDLGKFSQKAAYLIPQDAGRKTALAREIMKSFEGQKGVFSIVNHGVWPSSENLNLFHGYRRSLGESRYIKEVPHHVFVRGESSVIECLLAMSLYFSWDALLVELPRRVSWKFSHDEVFEVLGNDLSSFLEWAADFDLQKV